MHASDANYLYRGYDPRTGDEILYESLHRHQFPTFREVPDELEIVAGLLEEETGVSS